VFAVWVNFQKSRSEKRRDATSDQVLGLAPTRLATAQILTARLFPHRVDLPAPWQAYYERRIPTRARRCAPRPGTATPAESAPAPLATRSRPEQQQSSGHN